MLHLMLEVIFLLGLDNFEEEGWKVGPSSEKNLLKTLFIYLFEIPSQFRVSKAACLKLNNNKFQILTIFGYFICWKCI